MSPFLHGQDRPVQRRPCSHPELSREKLRPRVYTSNVSGAGRGHDPRRNAARSTGAPSCVRPGAAGLKALCIQKRRSRSGWDGDPASLKLVCSPPFISTPLLERARYHPHHPGPLDGAALLDPNTIETVDLGGHSRSHRAAHGGPCRTGQASSAPRPHGEPCHDSNSTGPRSCSAETSSGTDVPNYVDATP